MGICKFCREPAGFLSRAHKNCKYQYNEAKSDIMSLFKDIDSIDANLQSLEKKITTKAKSGYIDKDKKKQLIIAGWEQAVDNAFADKVLTEEEESTLAKLQNHFSLSQEELDKSGAYSKLVKGGILREILNGIIPEKLKINEYIPFNLQKTEKLVWIFQDVNYYEEKTRTHYVGGSKGFSVRIAKGLYYRSGAFKGERVQTSERIHADTGLLGVTNKHIYFSGEEKSFRINFDKIVTFEPFSDGIGMQRDTQTSKPQIFITDDGWFTYNLITNLAQM